MTIRWIAPRFGGLEVLTTEEFELAPPATGEVVIDVKAAGVNPADYKHFAAGETSVLPKRVGYEVAGIISTLGPHTEIASGGGAIGDEVLAFRVNGGFTDRILVPATDVFAKPPSLDFAAAANLLLAGTTASEMLHVTSARAGETIVVHGASGAVGMSVAQQAKAIGARVIGTASERNFAELRRFGVEPTTYGRGLEARIRELAPEGIAASLDAVGTDEAVGVSLALVADRSRIVTIAAFGRAQSTGIKAIAAAMPESAAYRDGVRAQLIEWAGQGALKVPVARTFPLRDAVAALELVKSGHPGGKVALIP